MAIFSFLSKHMRRAYQSSFILAACAGLVAIFLFVPYLNSYPMQNWDEGLYAQATREMIDTHDFFTLTYQTHPFFEKPPLVIWASAPLAQLFDSQNWTFRFWNALAGIATVVLLSLFLFQKEKRPPVAWLGTFIFLSAEALLYHCFRTGDMDGFLMFFSVFGFYAYWKSWGKPSWIIFVGIAFGLAVMSKSAAGLVGVVVVLLDIVLARRWQIVRSRHFLYAGVAFLCIVAPWHIIQTVQHGRQFWQSYLGFQVIERSVAQIFPTGFPWYWYVGVVARRLYPFSFLFPVAALLSFRQIVRGNKETLVLLLWSVLPLVGYSLAVTKFEQYILIVYPAIAWLVARLIIALLDKTEKYFFLRLTGVASIALAFFFFSRYATPHFLTDGFTTMTTAVRYVSSAIVAIGVSAVFILFRDKKRLFYGTVTVVLACCFFVSYARNIEVIVTQPRHSIYQDIAIMVRNQGASRVVVFDSDLYTKPAGYFELSKVVEEILPVVQKEAWKVRHFATPGSVVILDAASDLSVVKKDILIGVVDSYHLYYVPKE